MSKKQLTQQERTQERLLMLRGVKDTKAFSVTPQGYAQRNEACLIQLATHTNNVVRRAVAELPLLRDMFVRAMNSLEESKAIKAILQAKMEVLSTKEDLITRLTRERDDALALVRTATKK